MPKKQPKRKKPSAGAGSADATGADSTTELEISLLGAFGKHSDTGAIVPAYLDLVFTIDNFFTPGECEALIAACEAAGFAHAFHRAGTGYAHRDNGRLQLDSEAIADVVYRRLHPHLPTIVAGLGGDADPVACYSNIRLYRYEAGQSFGLHVDESCEAGPGFTEFTVLVYLNDRGVAGGSTAFYTGEVGRKKKPRKVFEFPPRAGTCLVHGHGERCLLHEGARVTKGTKYLFRTDVVCRPR